MNERTCQRCDVPSTPGYIPDHGHHNHLQLASWVKGVPVQNWWTGYIRRKGLPLTAYRCPQCGGVELVAPDMPPPSAK